MQALGMLVLVAFGFIAGYFLATTVLVFITIIGVVVGIIMAAKFQEMEHLITMVYWVCLVVIFITMWVTNFYVSDATWLHDIFGSLLRQR